MENIVFAPKPTKLEWNPGACPCKGPLILPPSLASASKAVRGIFPSVQAWPRVALTQQPGLGDEGYALLVGEVGAEIAYTRPAGAFYALITLGQLTQQSGRALPCCYIEDAPALPVRGLMLDISRGKVPKIETLFALADKLALLKMNHFELYIEGFSFAYPSFPEVWQDKTPITPDEVRRLDSYCKTRHIALVPNQNSLGHMGAWLGEERFAPLAERPEGGTMFGFPVPPNTMDPTDPGSLALVGRLSDDLLPCFESNWVNVGLDEPFELGQGKNSAAQAQGRIGEVYLDYVVALHAELAKRGKRMLMWGDIVARHPELVERLPKDIIVLEWGYEAEHPFQRRAEALQAAGLEYLICPGTSSWSSYAGITDNMLVNVRTAAQVAHTNGALGLVLTDWGDGGHPQYLPVSYAALVLAAADAWNKDAPLDDGALATALDTLVYRDAAGVLGAFSLELGRYIRYEEYPMPCRTLAAFVSSVGLVEADKWNYLLDNFVKGLTMFLEPDLLAVYAEKSRNRQPFDYAGYTAFLRQMEERLAQAGPQCPDAVLVLREYAATIAMLRYLGDAHALVAFSGEWSADERRAARDAIIAAAPALAGEHTALWNARNKPYGLDMSLGAIQRLAAQAAEK